MIRPCPLIRKLLILATITSTFVFILLQDRYRLADLSNQEKMWIGGDNSEKDKLVVRDTNGAEIASSSFLERAEPPAEDKWHNSTLIRVNDLNTYELMVPNATLPPPLLTPAIIKSVGVVRSELKSYFEKSNIAIDFTPGEAIPINKIRKILIVSTWRSGSTFLGDMLSSKRWTYYSYEPLILYDRYPDIQPDEIEKFFRLVRDIFTCNFAPHVDFIKYINKYQFLIKKNPVMNKLCSTSKKYLCHDPNFHAELCRYLPYNMIKIVRGDLIHFEPLLNDPALDLRVIFLIRDPRGVFNSRKKTTWCSTEMCDNVALGCQNMLSNLKMAEIWKYKYHGRFLTVRYEDLCLFPEETTKQILKISGLPYHGEIETYLKAHTRSTNKNKNHDGTYRNSANNAFKWRESFSFENVKEVQEHCHEVLDLLGMTYFKDEVDYKNMSIPIIGPRA